MLLALTGIACRQETVRIRTGLLLDGRGNTLRDAVVEVRGHRIAAVGRYAGGPVQLDLSQYTVLPGLIDAHVHISGYFNRAGKANLPTDGESEADRAAGRAGVALATLRGGFTTVASMGSSTDAALRREIESGKVPGPRILTSLNPFTDTMPAPEELRRLVRERRRQGADFIKIFASTAMAAGAAPAFSHEQLTALCDEARRLGIRSVVHAQSDASLRHVIAAGCDEIEHGSLITPEVIQEVAAAGIWFDPQCRLVLANYLENRSRFEGPGRLNADRFGLYEKLVPRLPSLVRAALATPGLKLTFGSDAVAGAHGRNVEDLICRVREGGQTAMAALVTATSANSEALGLGSRLGRVAVGYEADLIGVEGNPLDSIEVLRRVRFVMRGGRVFVSP